MNIYAPKTVDQILDEVEAEETYARVLLGEQVSAMDVAEAMLRHEATRVIGGLRSDEFFDVDGAVWRQADDRLAHLVRHPDGTGAVAPQLVPLGVINDACGPLRHSIYHRASIG